MKPNDMPLVCLPLDLCDDDAATLLQFLYDLTEALERHYEGQLLRRTHLRPDPPPNESDAQSADPLVLIRTTTTGRRACRTGGLKSAYLKSARYRQNYAGLLSR